MLLAALLVYFIEPLKLAAFAGAILLHELGHAVVLKLFGYSISTLSIGYCGFNMKYHGSGSEGEEFAAALAGPLVGMTLAILCVYAKNVSLSAFAKINVYLSAFNMLPVYPLDGGRAARILLHRRLDSQCCDRILQVFAEAVSLLLMFSGLCFLSGGTGIRLICVAVWLLCGNFLQIPTQLF